MRPLPEDFAKLDTVHIVYYIRCQARDAINQSAGQYLAGQKDEATARQGRALIAREISMAELDRSQLNRGARDEIDKYSRAAIAYDFTFDISEENDATASADLLDNFTNGSFGLNLSASQTRQRQNVRNFRISDTFGALTRPNNCAPDPRPINWAYPITGNIGLKEIIQTFVNLNEFQNLTGKDSADTMPVTADTIVFQTTLSGSATPKVTLNPLSNRLQLADATVGGTASRKDIHKVIVALSLPPEKNISGKTVPSGRLLGLQPDTSQNFQKSSAERNALLEISNQVDRQIITTLGTDRGAQ